MQIYTESQPGMIVLGVTPGYALKLNQRIFNKGTFLNPGSAGEFVSLLVFRQIRASANFIEEVENMYSVSFEL